jgi:hypothetical protein
MALARQSLTDALCQDVLRCVRFRRALGRFSAGRVLHVVNWAGLDVCHDGTNRPLSVFGVGVSGAGAGLGLRGVTIRTSLV